MRYELNIQGKNEKALVGFLEQLDFVKIAPQKGEYEAPLTDAEVIFGTKKAPSASRLKQYIEASKSEEARELSLVCEDVIAYLKQKKA